MDSLLIANRGEVAVRIQRACRTLGIEAVAVFTDADAGALHVRLADRAVRLEGSLPRSGYLDVRQLCAAAVSAGVDAVHPGYGFLSEQADFAAAVADAGLVFVGPPAPVIAMMGDKVAARAAASAAGVPVLPGSSGAVADLDEAAAVAEEVGYPLAVKASFGGGGRGLRVVVDPEGLGGALDSARREALASFGRPEVFIERYVTRPRHVEVQILADRHGAVVHLGDRDCSVQRRHQKLVEEAPAPGLADRVRAQLRASAVALAAEVGYVNAGTVEYVLDPVGEDFWFLEMNTRLQVEHGVTELVTGVDIVRAQLLVAGGEPLGFTQDTVEVRGHAVEVRVVAEDPYSGFLPSPGRIGALRLPDGPWIRRDFGVASGDAVTTDFDATIGKVLTWGPDRDQAIERMSSALDEFAAPGIRTVVPYVRTVLDQPSFRAATHSTTSVADEWPPDPRAPDGGARAEVEPVGAGGERTDAVLGAPVGRDVRLSTPGGVIEVTVWARRRLGGAAVAEEDPAATSLPAGRAGAAPSDPGARAPMDAVVASLHVAVGEIVGAGQVLLTLEAMKMEFEVRAATAGEVLGVHATVGQPVKAGLLLVDISGG